MKVGERVTHCLFLVADRPGLERASNPEGGPGTQGVTVVARRGSFCLSLGARALDPTGGPPRQ